VVVVCNGCSDDTAALAATFENVKVIETPIASKTAALNLGDQAARSFPRVYLDADIELPRAVISDLVELLERTGLPAGTVRYHHDLSSASTGVRRHFRARSRAPYPDHLVGRGVYCLSRGGRGRFGDFPDVIGDDLFVQSLFAPQECAVVETFSAVVEVPETVRELVRVQSRIAAGNREHRQLYPDSGQQGSFTALFRAHLQPGRWLDLATFVSVVGASRLLGRARAWAGSGKWETSRAPADTTAAEAVATHTMITAVPELEVPVSLVSWPELETWAAGALESGQGVTVCTVAPYQVYLWRSDPSYAGVLARASVVLVDGNGVRIALFAGGVRCDGRRTGREVVQRIFDGRLLSGARVAVIGSSPETQDALAVQRPNWLVLGGNYPMQPDGTVVAETVASLAQHEINVILVALGSPKSELWADAVARSHPGVYFSIGGAVDTVTGTRRPPPHAVERFGVEWAWRLAQDPVLVRRLARAAEVMPSLVARAVYQRIQR
jgi:exopolysaccharide biosynthesis WecB/TagA/CpsF family protein